MTAEKEAMTLVVCDVTLSKVVHLVADVLDVPKDTLGIETRASDVPAWDSFGHVRIVLAAEAEFGVRLSMAAVEKAVSIKGLVDAIEEAQRAA